MQGNTFTVDQHKASSVFTFEYKLTGVTFSNNVGGATANAFSKNLTVDAVYSINSANSGVHHWKNAIVRDNTWNFPNTPLGAAPPQYKFVTTTGNSNGGGWSVVGQDNLNWQGDHCSGCSHPDADHGLVNLSQTALIEPYGPTVYVNGNTSAATATVDATKEEDGAQVEIVNAGANPVSFISDSNLSLPFTYTLSGGSLSSLKLSYSAAAGKFILGNSAATVVASGGTPQSAVANTNFATQLQVTVTDANQYPVSGVAVTFSVPASGASAAFTGATTAVVSTNMNGVAIAPVLTANGQAGPYTVVASVAGLSTTAGFSLTNFAGAAAGVFVSAGTPQSATVSTAFATPLQAVVKDANSNPLSGITVTFTAPSSGASANFGGSTIATAITNASGLATAPALSANSQAGSYNVTANVAGISASAGFALTNKAGPATSVTAVAGNAQGTTINTPFPTLLQAVVKDASNNLLSGVLVTFTAPVSGASASFGSAATVTATTNASGVATAPALTANGLGGTYSVKATVIGVTTSANFGLTNLLGAAASITAGTGGGQSATINSAFVTALQATVKDAGNNVLSGVAVIFTAPAAGPGANFSGASSISIVTNASGIATVPVTANSQTGSYIITASVAGVATAATFSLSNVAGPPARMTASAGSGQSATAGAAFATALQVTIKDAGNNPVSGVSVTFTVPALGPSASFGGSTTAGAITNSSGIATAPLLTANSQFGSYSAVASTAGTSATASFALSNNQPVQVVPVSLVQQSAGSNVGNNQNTLTVRLANTPNAADVLILFFDQVSAAQTITSISGATWTRLAQNYTSNNGDFEIWAGTNPSSSNITITGTNYFGGFQPGYAIAAEFAGITTILDGSALLTTGGIWPAATGNISTINPNDLLLSATMSYNGGGVQANVAKPWNALAAAGQTYSLSAGYRSVTATGSYSATWTGTGSPQVPTIILALKAAAASGPSISATAGTSQSTAVNTPFSQSLQATLMDGSNHPVSGATVTFSVPPSTASASFAGSSSATAITNSSGVATAPPLIANSQAGSYSVTATAAGVSTPASFSLTNLAGPAASITASGGNAQTSPISTAFATALQSTVKDAAGNSVSGVIVTFTLPASGASGVFSGSLIATTTTNANGIATAPTLVANSQPGAFNATAAAAGVSAPASFSLTNLSVVGIPVSIAATAGTPQSASTSSAFGSPLQAIVKDANNNPISGLSVTFAAPANGPSASFGGSATTSVITNASGIAVSPAFAANSQAGSYTVSASVTGVSTSVSFSLTNIAGSAASISASSGTPQSAAVNSAFATVLQATVKDAGNNPVSGALITFTAPTSGASATFSGSTSSVATTNSNGVATAAALTANSQTGSYTVTASVNGAANAASFALSNTSVVSSPAIAFVQQATGTNLGNNQNTLTITLASPPQPGNTLILFFDHVSAQQTITSISGASWTQLAKNQTSNNGDSEIWLGVNPISSTFTITGSNYFGGFQPGYAIMAEFSGVSATLDGRPMLTTSGIWPQTTGTLTTSNASDLLLTMTLSYNGGGVSASVGNPWSLLHAPSGTYSLSAAYQILSTAGAYSANWSGNGSPQVGTIILALK